MKEMKQEIEGTSKKETSRYSFISGFLAYMNYMDQVSAKLAEKAKQNPKDFEKIIETFKNTVREGWETKEDE